MTGRPVKWAEIDTAALRGNASAVLAHLGRNTAVMGMVKANGYGHGAAIAGRAFLEGGATWLGVSSPEEALDLRAAGIDAPILNVNWTHPTHLAGMVGAGVHIAVFDRESVRLAVEAAGAMDAVALVHVKVDTGMNRLGARPEDVEALVDALRRAGGRVRIDGIFTHFADADGDDTAFTERQIENFEAVLPSLRELAPGALVHAANSAGALRMPQSRYDLVRMGIALYGYAPDHCRDVVSLHPAMTMVACVTQVKTVLPGDTVGYGRLWTAEAPARIAVVAAGYADGVFRAQSNRGAVVLGEVRCPMVGRISMDQVTVDVSAVAGVRAGDEAVLIGGRGTTRIGADEVGAAAGTVAYEVLCAVSSRVLRLTGVGSPS